MIFINNHGESGGALLAAGGTVSLTSCRFFGNVATNGGAIYFDNQTKATVDHCLFQGNQASDSGGAVFVDPEAQIQVINSTLTHNRAMFGSGVYLRNCVLKISNSILSFADQGEAICLIGTPTVAISYSNIFGNMGGDWIGDIAGLLGVLGNIAADPLYVAAEDDDFNLAAGSPCIDAGDPQSPGDPDGTVADMGAFYFDQLTAVGEHADSAGDSAEGIGLTGPGRLPLRLLGNPAGHATQLHFVLRRSRRVAVELYDLRGRVVRAKNLGSLPSGPQQTVLDTSGLPSGLYCCRLRADGLTASQKLILLK